MIWRSTRSPVHSGSQGGRGCSMAPGRPGEEAGSDHSPGPSSFLAPCRPPRPAALKIRPGLITYLNSYMWPALCRAQTVHQCFSILVRKTPCPARFRCLLATLRQIQVSRSLPGFCRVLVMSLSFESGVLEQGDIENMQDRSRINKHH